MTFDPRTATTPNFRHPIGEEPMTEIKPNMDAISAFTFLPDGTFSVTFEDGSVVQAQVPPQFVVKTFEQTVVYAADILERQHVELAKQEASNDAMQLRMDLCGEKYRGQGE